MRSDIINLTGLAPTLPEDTPEWARLLFTEVRAIRETHEAIARELNGVVDVAKPMIDGLSSNPALRMLLGA